MEGLSIEFELPLFDKQRYGEFAQLLRSDKKNINYVTKRASYQKQVDDSLIDVGLYTINNRYNSGNQLISFTPYLGITEYDYEHYGTTYTYHMQLKEYKVKE